MASAPFLRIGELSKRTGVSAELLRAWERRYGLLHPAVLACLPGEHHDHGLIAFGLALRTRGRRVVYLGPDTPTGTVDKVNRDLDPNLVVLGAVSDERLDRPPAGDALP